MKEKRRARKPSAVILKSKTRFKESSREIYQEKKEKEHFFFFFLFFFLLDLVLLGFI